MKLVKKSVAVLLALVMSVSCFSLMGFAEETATQEHLTEVPEGYVGIYTKDDLDNIKLDMTGNYILMNDIVFDDSDYEKGGSFYNSGKGWEPIGTSSTKFTGIFDGNGYSIKNFYINNPEKDNIGLFGYASNATIKNITINNANIAGGNYVGGIVGYISSCTIADSNFNGSVVGGDYVGGITGYSYWKCTIVHCNAQGNINGNQYVGGIVGYQDADSSNRSDFDNYISYCRNSSLINAMNYGGGIAGYSYSYNHYVNSYNYWEGQAFIEFCVNSGLINVSNSYAGGVTGASYGGTNNLYYCYNNGTIKTLNYAGGLIGKCINYVLVKHSYSVGTIDAESNFGGCFGSAPNSSTFCYYLDEAVTNPTCTSGIAKSEDQLKKATAYEQWDFNTVWTMGGREDYPYPELVDVPLVLPEDYAHKHEYISEITKEATHTETGVLKYTCECGDSYTEEIAKTTEHRYTSAITKEATHTATGVMKYICDCGDTYTEDIEKIAEHAYNEVVTAPTCEKQGYTTFTCECGDTYVGRYVNPTGHNYQTEDVAPNCTEQGYTTYICSCGYSYVANYINPLGHKYDSVVTAPTCTAQGYTTFTCDCGDSYVGNYVVAAGHVYATVVTAPTCTEKGYTTYTCVCGDSYVANYVNANGHIYTSEATTPATHLTTGIMTYTCECGYFYTEVIAKTTEHTYASVTTAPTCTEEGYTTYTCACGYTYVDNYVDATGHADNNGDGYCDADNEFIDPTIDCDCNCHKSGIKKFFFDFILFFQRLFGSNKTCECGAAHY